MRIRLILFGVLSLTGLTCIAQQDSLIKDVKTYKATIKTLNRGVYKGMIININLDSILIGPSWNQFHYSEIKSLRFRKKGGPGRSMLIGGSSGMAVGVIAGLVEGSDPEEEWFGMTAGAKALSYGLTLGIIGAGMGAVISSAATKVHQVNGDQNSYNNAVQYLRNDILKRKKNREQQY